MAITCNGPVRQRTIAQAAGVSTATVSMALSDHPGVNEETRRKVQKLCRELGYKPSKRQRNIGSGRAGDAGVQRLGFMVIGTRLDEEAHAGILHALVANAMAAQNRLEVRAIEDVSDERLVIDQTMQFAESLDGVVLTGFVSRALLMEMGAARRPHVVLGHAMVAISEVNTGFGHIIAVDEMAMGRLATQTLLARGHKRIGFICERAPKGLWADRWLEGYRMAMMMAQADVKPEWVHVAGKLFAGGAPAAEAMAKMQAPPTAYVVPNVRVAASFRQGLQARGIGLPCEALVVSCEERLLAQYGLEDCPWISYDVDLLGSVAIRQLLALSKSPMPCSCEVLVPFRARNVADTEIESAAEPKGISS